MPRTALRARIGGRSAPVGGYDRSTAIRGRCQASACASPAPSYRAGRPTIPADFTLALAILVALAFAVTNGFNDAANAIAALVATRVARPAQAVALAAVFNLIGPLLFGGAVAGVVGSMVSVPAVRLAPVLGAGLSGAVAWNTLAWRRGLPSSSSHALVGGLVGAAVLDSGLGAVQWGPVHDGRLDGVFGILLGLLLAVVFGFAVSLLLERLVLRMMTRATIRFRAPVRGAQWIGAASLAFSHGSNDAQKTIGIVGALLLAGGHSSSATAPLWVVFASAVALTFGTALGGWSIVRTIGRRIYPIRSIDGLVSQVSSAGVIFGASIAGAPISTSQVVASSVVGIGVGRGRWRHVGWGIVRRTATAWLTTMPAAAVIAAILLPAWKLLPGG